MRQPQPVDCDKYAKQSLNLKLDGRDIMIIFNALMLYNAMLPPPGIFVCDDCKITQEHLANRFNGLLERVEQRAKNEGKSNRE